CGCEMAGLAWPRGVSATKKLVRTMTSRKFGALVASVSAIALVFAASETAARGAMGGAPARGGVGVVRPLPHGPHGLHGFRHRGRNDLGGFLWPGYGDFGSGAYGSAAGVPITGPLSGPNEIVYTYKQDVPWDWAHRFPPNVVPSDRQYVPGCGAEAVDVGGGKTVNVFRCY